MIWETFSEENVFAETFGQTDASVKFYEV